MKRCLLYKCVWFQLNILKKYVSYVLLSINEMFLNWGGFLRSPFGVVSGILDFFSKTEGALPFHVGHME